MDAFCKHGMLKTRCPICNPDVKTEKPSPKIFVKDRNLAFKCNWLDTDYEGPCGKEGRRWNIHVKRFPWCTQPENPCYQYEMGFRKNIPPYPCYETEIFSRFEYGAGSDDVAVNYLRKQREVLVRNGHVGEAKIVEKVIKRFYENFKPY